MVEVLDKCSHNQYLGFAEEINSIYSKNDVTKYSAFEYIK